MAPRGRKPKPYLLKKAEGFRGHRQHAEGVGGSSSLFESPVKLSDEAMAEWKRIRETAPWIEASDAAALADRCVCWERMLRAQEEVNTTGLTVDTKEGVKLNPAVNALKVYRQALVRYDAELGLTSSSRSRVGTSRSAEGGLDPIEAAAIGVLPA